MLIQTVGFGKSAEVASTLVSDTFTDTNGTSLTAHTPDVDTVGGGWSLATATGSGSGTFTIENNKLEATRTSSTYFPIGTIDVGQADVTIDVNLTFETDDFGFDGIVFRYQDQSNFWFATREATSGDFRILEKNAGVNTERASIAAGISAGTNHDMQVVLSGTSITATIDGGNEITFSSSFLETETTHGLIGVDRADPSVGTKFDNFQIAA